jgi:hypothetical protein
VRGACDERSRRAERRMCTTVGASDSPLREMSAATEGIRSLAGRLIHPPPAMPAVLAAVDDERRGRTCHPPQPEARPSFARKKC